MESMINIYLKDNSLLISAPKSTVMLFTSDQHQFQMHPDITLEDTQLPLERSPKILGVIMDPSISFHKHCNYVSDWFEKRNEMLKALAGSSWGQDKETLLMTYNAWGNLSQTMQYQSGSPTQMTRALRKYRQCRLRL